MKSVTEGREREREREEGSGGRGELPKNHSGPCTRLSPHTRKTAVFLSQGIHFPKEILMRFSFILFLLSIFQSFIKQGSQIKPQLTLPGSLRIFSISWTRRHVPGIPSPFSALSPGSPFQGRLPGTLYPRGVGPAPFSPCPLHQCACGV